MRNWGSDKQWGREISLLRIANPNSQLSFLNQH